MLISRTRAWIWAPCAVCAPVAGNPLTMDVVQSYCRTLETANDVYLLKDFETQQMVSWLCVGVLVCTCANGSAAGATQYTTPLSVLLWATGL